MKPVKGVLTLVLLMALNLVHAQTGHGITKDQQLKLDAYMKGIDGRILESFKSAPTLRSEMEASLKLINDQKDSILQLKMASDYRKKYSGVYRKILSGAGLTAASIIADLTAIFPQLKFTVDSFLNIKGSSPGTMQIMSSNTAPTGTSARMVFDLNKSMDCGGLAGGRVVNRSNSIEARSVSGVAGGCTVDGTYSSTFTMPAFTSATLSWGYTLHGEGLAAGIVGTAAVYSNAFFDGIDAVDANGRQSELAGFDIITSIAFAPLLWVSSALEVSTRPRRYVLIPGGSKKLVTTVDVYNMTLAAVCCGSYGKSRASGLDFIITYQ